MDATYSVLPSADDPAEIAFGRGCQAMDSWDLERARGLFEEAISGSGPQMLWRVAEACLTTEDSAFWMRRAVVSESEPGGITVDPGALPILGGGDGDAMQQHWEIAVESNDPARAVAALTAAQRRLGRVLEDGHELSPEEAEDDDTELYSPNYVAVEEEVPRVWMDCKGGMFPYMARTALRIVADELRKAGVRQAHLFTRPASHTANR
ncbi:hypothetical protein ACOT81_19470 [Streptomyces sp. WI04-05B]|uniref:hypothetical protein n=1 Tax=Streptomyces TaxID=1883 RepID=UPI0029AF6AE3|nr:MULTISPECIES: hypothetical protein [unclassified Streptomyces]MDX2542436.1 hypothetical protein [Streptomyces sp. WI04-05B]MDX2582545.1 hypothetical protein [Streptomyces sp. WI04-05A]